MKAKLARLLRREMKRYELQPGSPLSVPVSETITSKTGPKEGDVEVTQVKVNHVRRVKKDIIRAGDMYRGIATYGQRLIDTIEKKSAPVESKKPVDSSVSAKQKKALARSMKEIDRLEKKLKRKAQNKDAR